MVLCRAQRVVERPRRGVVQRNLQHRPPRTPLAGPGRGSRRQRRADARAVDLAAGRRAGTGAGGRRRRRRGSPRCPGWFRTRCASPLRQRGRVDRAPTARRVSGHGPATAPTRRRPADPSAPLYALRISDQRHGSAVWSRRAGPRPPPAPRPPRPPRGRRRAPTLARATARSHGEPTGACTRGVTPCSFGERAHDLQRGGGTGIPGSPIGERRVRPPREPAGRAQPPGPEPLVDARGPGVGAQVLQPRDRRPRRPPRHRRRDRPHCDHAARATRTGPRRVCTTSAAAVRASSPTASVSWPDPSRCRSATRRPMRSSGPSTPPSCATRRRRSDVVRPPHGSQAHTAPIALRGLRRVILVQHEKARVEDHP